MKPLNSRSLFFVTLPLIGYLIFIFYLSSQQQAPYEIPVRNFDKVVHFSLYLPASILFLRFLRRSPYSFIQNNFWLSGIIFSLLYAASDEWHQSFVPTRHMDFLDWLADAAGILAGTGIYWVYWRWRSRRES